MPCVARDCCVPHSWSKYARARRVRHCALRLLLGLVNSGATLRLPQVGYTVGLIDDPVGDLGAERFADCVLVRRQAIRRELRRADDALAHILNELFGILSAALAGEVADDRPS